MFKKWLEAETGIPGYQQIDKLRRADAVGIPTNDAAARWLKKREKELASQQPAKVTINQPASSDMDPPIAPDMDFFRRIWAARMKKK